MIFGPDLLPKVLNGTKTVTRRRLPMFGRGRSAGSYEAGRTYVVTPGRGRFHVAHIQILSIREEPLCKVYNPGEAQLEGFQWAPEFARYWERLHGPTPTGVFQSTEVVARIEFKLARRCERCQVAA